MANHIAKVAQMLGVEIGESFKLTDDTHGDYRQYYQFTYKKGFETSVDGVKWKTAAAEVLRDILMGDIKIVKLPWKPKTGEKYYVPNIFNWNYYNYYLCVDNERDEELYKRGLVFKTEEEAIEMSKKMLAMAKEREDLT